MWDAMYDGPIDSFEKFIFRERRDFAVRAIKENVGSEGMILDLGCGAGPFTSEVLKYKSNVIAADYSADILEKARARIQSVNDREAALSQCNSEKLPFKSGSFAAVVCLGVISYVPNRFAAVEEMYRVLKEDGLLILTFRNFYNAIAYDPINLIQFAVGRIPNNIHCERNGEFVAGAFLKPGDIQILLERVGFDVESCLGIGRGPFKVKQKQVFSLKISLWLDSTLKRILSMLGFRRSLHGADVAIFVCRKKASSSKPK